MGCCVKYLVGWPNRKNCRCEDHEPTELKESEWFDGKCYRNHFTHPPLAEGILGSLSWVASRAWNYLKEKAPPAETVTPSLSCLERPAPLQITWLGHATVLVQIDGQNILVDPCLSWSPFPLFARRLVRSPVSIDELPRIDIVLVTHNHKDHLDESALRQIVIDQRKRFGDTPQFFVPSGLSAWFQKRQISIATEVGWWEEKRINGLLITATPAQHWSYRDWDINRSHWCGWVVKTHNHSIYVTGDTGYANFQGRGSCQDFREIHLRYGAVDLAVISVGDCYPEWFMCTHHITPTQAVEIHRDVGAKRSVAVHWGTFDLSDEFPDQAVPIELDRACNRARIAQGAFFVMKIGETRVI